jgi:trk system potassium uptake protein TrkH
LLVALGMSPLAAFSGTIATMGNVGPGLDTVGSLENFSHVPELGKWILTATMLLGRLEIYGLIMLVIPGVWRGAGRPLGALPERMSHHRTP